MSPSARYDVVIVGARCAGAATAMLTARRGMKVLALDRGAYGSDTLSTHALMRGAVVQLRKWGLLDAVKAAGTPPVRATTFHYDGEAVPIAVKPVAGTDALFAPRRTVLDALLVDAARDAGAEIRHGHALVDLLRDDDGRVRGVVAYDPQGRRESIGADLVVGADGLGSTVAQFTGAATVRRGRHATSTVFGYWSGLGDVGGFHWHFAAEASVGVIPTNDGLCCVFVSVPPAVFADRLRAAPPEGFQEILRRVSPALAERVADARLEGRLRMHAGHKGVMRRPWGPGWALVGDASYFKDPLTAHGITDAFRDAQLLSEAAAAGTPLTFAAHERLRDELSIDLFETTDEIASFEWDMPRLKALHMDLNAAMKREVEFLAGETAAAKEGVAA